MRLILVLGVLWIVLHVAGRRRAASAGAAGDAVESLGQWHLSRKHQLQLIRIGRRLFVFSITDHAVRLVAEINDAAEIDALLAGCRGTRGRIVGSELRRFAAVTPIWPAEGQ